MATYNEYEDKEALIENPSIPDINKVKADDMNYIKYNLPHISNEVDEDYRVNLLETKNLFDKNNYISNVNINSTTKIVQETSGNVSIIIPIKPNTTYTISKVSGDRFNVGSSPIYPTIGYTFTNLQVLYTATECTITTGANDKYLMAWVYTTADTHTQQETLDSIQVEEGNEATTYSPFVQNQILVDNEKYTDTINVGSVVDSRSRVNFLKSKNLYNNKTDLTNTIVASDGSLTTAEGYVCSQLIPVKPSSTYAISYVNLSASEKIIRIGYYQQDGTPITRTTIGENGTITTQANCYYIRVSYLLSTNKNVQVEEGSTITSYQPYDYASIYVDNEEIYSKPVVLWENGSPTSAFAGQQITLSDSIENYSYYEVIFEYSTSYNYSLSTGKINTNLKGLLIAPSSILQRRFISAISGTSMSFLNGQKITTYGGSATDDNTLCVPLQVIGYK